MSIGLKLLAASSALALMLLAGNGPSPGYRGASSHPVTGTWLAAGNSEAQRIESHLRNVEVTLRARQVPGLTARQRDSRDTALNRLREYRERGLFPHNHTRPGERVPVFVDEHGTHCAVGYLLKRSGEIGLVSDVVAGDNNVRVMELAGNERFRRWLEETGLTLEEAAWIQPTYGQQRDLEPPAQDLSLTVAGGIATGGLALFSFLTEAGPREFQAAGTLNAALSLFHLGIAVLYAGRDGPDGIKGIAMSGVLSVVSGHAALHRFLQSREKRMSQREAWDEELGLGQEAGAERRLRVSLPEPAWIHGRLGVRFRATH